MSPDDFKLIINAIESGKCLALLGAGACTAFSDHAGKQVPGLPTGSELAKWLADQCGYTNGTSYDLARVAEYYDYTHSGDRTLLEHALQEKLQINCCPRPIHTVLAQLKQIKIIITSNYDNLLENELAHYNRVLSKHIYNPQNPRTGHFQRSIFFHDRDVVLHKMHGSVDTPGSMVITLSDYIHYLTYLNDIDRGMPEYFRKIMIPQHTLLFLGYSLNDWNFQVIWEGVLAHYNASHLRKDAYAIIQAPSNSQIRYWGKRNIIILNDDIHEFAKQLARPFNLEIPQLGKKPEGGNP